MRQISTAWLMYTQDYDERTPPTSNIVRYVDKLIGGLTGMRPSGVGTNYLKSDSVFFSLAQTTPIAATYRNPSHGSYHYALRVWPDYGYNNRILTRVPACPSPANCPTPATETGRSLATIASPAETVLLSSSTYGYPTPYAPDKPYMGSHRVDPPGWWDPNSGPPSENPAYYGLCWPRYNGMFTVSFVDGHVKAMNAGQLGQASLWDLE